MRKTHRKGAKFAKKNKRGCRALRLCSEKKGQTMNRRKESTAKARIVDCGLRGVNPKSEIRNPKWAYVSRFTFHVLLFLICGSTISHANTGGAGGAFLQLGGGARACGMGGAYTAVADDIYSLHWNPGGLNHLTRTEVAASYRFMSLDRRCFFSGIAQPLEPGGGYALGWLYAGTEVDRRDINGNITGRMSDSENAFYFAFARELPLPLPASLGLTMKYLYQTLADQSAKGLGFDLGLQLQLPGNFRMGCVIKDIGTHLSWETASEDDVPSGIVGGLSWRALSNRLLVAADASKSCDLEADVRLGAEFVAHPMLSIRGGVNHLLEAELRSFSAGFDIRTLVTPGFFRFGYAYVTDPIGAGNSHVGSVMMGF